MRSRLGWVGEGGRGVQQDEFRRQAYWTGWAVAEELKQDFNTYKHVLTEEEVEIIRKYEEEQNGGKRQSRWDRPFAL